MLDRLMPLFFWGVFVFYSLLPKDKVTASENSVFSDLKISLHAHNVNLH